MGIIGLIKFFLLISGKIIHEYAFDFHSAPGGLAGLVMVIVSYLLQLPPQDPLTVEDLDPEQQQLFSRGELREVLGHQMFSLKQGNSKETVILIHGFPTSSFDYFNVIDKVVS